MYVCMYVCHRDASDLVDFPFLLILISLVVCHVCLESIFLSQLIGWLSKMRRTHGKIFRIFTGSRPYVVLMDKVVSVRTRTTVLCTLRRRRVCPACQ